MGLLHQRLENMSTNHADIVEQLNSVLKAQLACVNQCFLHARILKHQGLMDLADGEYKESIDAMKFADKLLERILSLGGMPNMQDMGKFKTGQAVDDMMAFDLELKEQNKALMERVLAFCTAKQDQISVDMLTKMLDSVNEHIAYLRAHPAQSSAA
jgi:bacterioferritin